MAYQLQRLNTTTTTDTARRVSIDTRELLERLERLVEIERPRYRRLWAYYRNPMRPLGTRSGTDDANGKPYQQAQEWGLPARITGGRAGAEPFCSTSVDSIARKEIVIENDIGWRVDTMVDFLFGKPLVIDSAAPDAQRRELIGKLLRLVVAHNGGLAFLQQLALLGSVYGFVDVLVKLDADACRHNDWAPRTTQSSCSTRDLGQRVSDEPSDDPSAADDAPPHHAEPAPSLDDLSNTSDPGTSMTWSDALLQRIARLVRFEIVEPARALPVLAGHDWRQLDAYVQCYDVPATPTARKSLDERRNRWLAWLLPGRASVRPSTIDDRVTVVEVLTADRWQRYEDERLVTEGRNSLGQLPLVHIQNTAVPFEYAGVSDVEPLIPLQDELNTRLSDRAHRISLQSFKIYLGKGIDGFIDQPVSPGRMWMTDNEQASVQEFGGDASCPSEDAHISDLREAMDKSSGVTPIAAGPIKGRIGHLTSAAALRITLQALLAKTDKKRGTYGGAISRLCELSLAWLDRAGVFPTAADERAVTINWPSPVPENEQEKLQEAEAKLRVGVNRDIVLRELGY